MADIDALIQLLVQEDGSDLHLCVGRPPYIRQHGDMKSLELPEASAEEESLEALFGDGIWALGAAEAQA